MDEALRPDLSKILPKPWVRQLADASPVAGASAAPPGDAADYLLEVTPSRALEPDDVGFGLAQATAVAARLAAALQKTSPQSAARLHDLDRVAVTPLLDR